MRQFVPPLLSLLSLTAFGCTPDGDLPPLPDRGATEYRMGPGDRLRIITYGEEQLTGDFTVNDSGNIEVPLLGSMPARGDTVVQLQTSLAAALKQRKLLQRPSVSVEISAYRPIFVLGEVTKPGAYPYQPGMTILSAVAVAGGFTDRAVHAHAAVTRSIDGVPVKGTGLPDTQVAPGDVVAIPERRF